MAPGIMKRTVAAQCPHLGSAEDPFTRDSHASDEHRCYAQLVGERVDLSHQRRFCLSSAHARCPFLEISALGKERDWQAQAGAWWRTVSPANRAPTAAQLGEAAGLGAAAARTWLGSVAMTTLQTWRSVRPSAVAPTTANEEEPLSLHEGGEATPAETHQLQASPYDTYPVGAADGVQLQAPAHHSDVLAPAHSDASAASVDHADMLMSPARGELAASARRSTHDPEIASADARQLEASPYDTYPAGSGSPSPEAIEDAREWFWRAKNAETIDDVVECLERANQLDPDNEMIASNLDWARQRAEAARVAAKRKPQREPTESMAPATIWTQKHRKPPLALRALGMLMDLVRAGLALAAYAMGGALVLAALPDQLREDLSSTLGVPWILSQVGAPTISLPDASRLSSLVHVPLGDGYDLGLALPYALGFLAMFIGMGLMRRQPSPTSSQ